MHFPRQSSELVTTAPPTANEITDRGNSVDSVNSLQKDIDCCNSATKGARPIHGILEGAHSDNRDQPVLAWKGWALV
jgi:hypothetical protein